MNRLVGVIAGSVIALATIPVATASAAPCGNGAIGDAGMGRPECKACVNLLPTNPTMQCTNPADPPDPVPTISHGSICDDAKKMGATGPC
jgi:hypothetical protein